MTKRKTDDRGNQAEQKRGREIPARDLRRRIDGERLKKVRKELGLSLEDLKNYMPENSPHRNKDAIDRLEKCRGGDDLPSLEVNEEFLEAVYEAFKKAIVVRRSDETYKEAVEQVRCWGGWQALLRGGDRIPVGREKEYEAVKSFLMGEKEGKFKGLTGMAGVGKSYLMESLAQDEDIQDFFTNKIVRIWIGHSESEPTCRRIAAFNCLAIRVAFLLDQPLQELTEWWQRAGCNIDHSSAVHTHEKDIREKVIHRWIGDKRVLIFIDDVWREDDLKTFEFLKNCTNAKVVYTTRHYGMAYMHSPPIRLEILKKECAVQLLTPA